MFPRSSSRNLVSNSSVTPRNHSGLWCLSATLELDSACAGDGAAPLASLCAILARSSSNSAAWVAILHACSLIISSFAELLDSSFWITTRRHSQHSISVARRASADVTVPTSCAGLRTVGLSEFATAIPSPRCRFRPRHHLLPTD